ncbi:MAG: hypothetical protein MUF43_05750 [Flavobacterium sp.]|nr:hypothetical protein [Flavobacterium sp.]
MYKKRAEINVEYTPDIWKKLMAAFDWNFASQMLTTTLATLVSYLYNVFHDFRKIQVYNSTESLDTHIWIIS